MKSSHCSSSAPLCKRMRKHQQHQQHQQHKNSTGKPVFCQLLSDAEVKRKQQCLVCRAMMAQGHMCDHVGSHILQGHVGGDACGFCDGTSCTPVLTAIEQAGRPDGCRKFEKVSTMPCKDRANNCNNHPGECPECKLVGWTYSMHALLCQTPAVALA